MSQTSLVGEEYRRLRSRILELETENVKMKAEVARLSKEVKFLSSDSFVVEPAELIPTREESRKFSESVWRRKFQF